MTDDDGGRNRRERGNGPAEPPGGGRRDRPVRRDGPNQLRRDRNRLSSRGSSQGRKGQTDATAAVAARQVTVETDSVSATLIGIPEVGVQELAYEHQIDRSRLEGGTPTQPVALFDLHNVGRSPIKWTTARTRFIGDDGYSYSPAQLSIDPGALGPGIHTRRVELRPDRSARVAALVEQLPEGVRVAEVVQTVSVRAGGTETEQLVFSLTG